MRFDNKTTRRRVTKYAFNELSSVKTGAASTAKATILKTAADPLDTALLAAGFTLDECAVVKTAIDTSQPVDAQIAALALQFGKACDNIPDVSNTVTTGDADMSDTKTPEQLQKELDAQTARVAELETLAKMSDDEKSYMSKMSDEDKKKWMAMTAEERKAKMKTEKAADEQYTMTDGQVIAKSAVGDTAFAFMKAQDQRIAKMEEERQQAEAIELVKTLCPNLPGTPEAMAGAIRKCRNSLTTEEFSVIEKALKAGDEAMKARTVAKAHDKPVGNADAQKVFDDAITKIANDKRISKSAAYSTPEGLEAAAAFRSATEGDE